MKILLAEDTREINRVVTLLLEREHYWVDSAFDGAEALDKIIANAYDCVLLDIMMPKRNGLEVLAEMRRRHITTPVIMLTAKAEIEDRVAGLDAGADDYLPKPFSYKELLARIRSATRRSAEYGSSVLSFGDVTLDPATFALSARSSIRLSVKEFALMQVLIGESSAPISTEALLGRVWKGEAGADADAVWLYVSYLRSKLTAIGSSLEITGSLGGSFRLR